VVNVGNTGSKRSEGMALVKIMLAESVFASVWTASPRKYGGLVGASVGWGNTIEVSAVSGTSDATSLSPLEAAIKSVAA
jgi:hypothetical protein